MEEFVRRAKARRILEFAGRRHAGAVDRRVAHRRGTASPPSTCAAAPGWTIGSGVDCLIADGATGHGLPVLHDDRDYPALARVSELQQRQIPR